MRGDIPRTPNWKVLLTTAVVQSLKYLCNCDDMPLFRIECQSRREGAPVALQVLLSRACPRLSVPFKTSPKSSKLRNLRARHPRQSLTRATNRVGRALSVTSSGVRLFPEPPEALHPWPCPSLRLLGMSAHRRNYLHVMLFPTSNSICSSHIGSEGLSVTPSPFTTWRAATIPIRGQVKGPSSGLNSTQSRRCTTPTVCVVLDHVLNFHPSGSFVT